MNDVDHGCASPYTDASKLWQMQRALGTLLFNRGNMVSAKVFIAVSISSTLLAGCMQAAVTPATQSAAVSETSTVTSTKPPSADSQNGVTSVGLQIGSKQVTLTLVQNNKVVPITVQDSKHGEVTLAPDTFTIRLEGDKEYTYIAGQADQTLLLALESYKRPLATFDAGYVVFVNNDLRIFDPSLTSLPTWNPSLLNHGEARNMANKSRMISRTRLVPSPL